MVSRREITLADLRTFLDRFGFSELRTSAPQVVFVEKTRGGEFVVSRRNLVLPAELSVLRSVLTSKGYTTEGEFAAWLEGTENADLRRPLARTRRSRPKELSARDTPSEFNFVRGTHTFFDDLLTYLVAVASIGSALGTQLQMWSGRWRRSESFVMTAVSARLGYGLVFYPHDVMETIAHDSWPEVIKLHVESVPETITQPLSTQLADVPSLERRLVLATYVHYFESVREDVEPRYRTHPTYEFARAIRNAFAHGGHLAIHDPEARVRWREFEYSATDSGRDILGNEIGPVEVILLMQALDELVRDR